eukprot:gene1056-732_t
MPDPIDPHKIGKSSTLDSGELTPRTKYEFEQNY